MNTHTNAEDRVNTLRKSLIAISNRAIRQPMVLLRTPDAVDASALAKLGRDTFVETFGHLYSAEDLNSFLDQTFAVDAVAADIADPARALLVAEDETGLIGYCKLGFTVSLDYDPGDRRAMELKQLYVRESAIGSGLGARLMQWALDQARARGFDMIILSVWSENFRAQRFYQRHGFAKIGDTIFMVGNHRDEEFLYGLDLEARAQARPDRG